MSELRARRDLAAARQSNSTAVQGFLLERMAWPGVAEVAGAGDRLFLVLAFPSAKTNSFFLNQT